MNKNSKRVLSIIVLTIFAMSFITLPTAFAALSTPDYSPSGDAQVGDTITVEGDPGDLTSGAEVRVYWDYADGPNVHLLASGYGDPDGDYAVEIEIPVTTVGTHYIWVRDVATDLTEEVAINIIPSVVATPNSGLKGDSILIEGYGFPAEEEVQISFYNTSLSSPYAPTAYYKTNMTAFTSDESGYFTGSVTVPSDATVYGTNYVFFAESYTGTTSYDNFSISASISLNTEEGPAGTVVTVSGRGYNAGALTASNFNVMYPNGYVQTAGLSVTDTTITVGSNGLFTAHFVIPSLAEGEYKITVSQTGPPAVSGSANFTITGETSITTDPTFGAPGASIVIEGYNYTRASGNEVTIDLAGTTKVVAVESDGSFTTTISVPAVAFAVHSLTATDDYGVNSSVSFKVGILAVIINPTSGPSGTNITVTGVGFFYHASDPHGYNVTFNDELIEYGGKVHSGETVYTSILVPTTAPGEYQVAIVDAKGAVLGVPFTVTAGTTLTPSPANVAIGYELGLSGSGYAYSTLGSMYNVSCYIYNSTWATAITVNDCDSGYPVQTDGDGMFEGCWTVPDACILGNTYTINGSTSYANGTVISEQYAETNITIVEEEVEIGPTKSSYALGEIVTFRLKATFKKANAILELRDPNDELYFKSNFTDLSWTKVGDWWVVQVRNQIDGATLFPYLIPEDSMTGTWSWSFVYSDDKNFTGTIEVVPATAAMLYDSLTAVADQLTNVTDIVNGQQSAIGDIQTGLSDLASTVAGNSDTLDTLGDQVASAVSQASSAVDAANQAVSAAQSATSAANQAASVAQDAVAAANSAKVEAQSAKTAAQAAETAANAAADASNGLSTLVYGAIAASLIAALAAIVSLMQINKRIAG